MPIFNEESTLANSIESVLSQTEGDLELIIVDDASTDGSRDIINGYLMIDKRIKLIVNKFNSRTGVVQWEPRNDGLKYATGKFIAYLDGDNLWVKNFLYEMSLPLKQLKCLQLTYCRSKNYYSLEEAAIARSSDPRRLLDSGCNWNIFKHGNLELNKLGKEQYVDTNEMMHRVGVFQDTAHLWKTFHLKRKIINTAQGINKSYRRHNDLELVERILSTYGINSCWEVDNTLVEYFYDSFNGHVKHLEKIDVHGVYS